MLPHNRNLGTKGEWPEFTHATANERTKPNPRWIQSKLADNMIHNTKSAVVFSIKNCEEIGLGRAPGEKPLLVIYVAPFIPLSRNLMEAERNSAKNHLDGSSEIVQLPVY